MGEDGNAVDPMQGEEAKGQDDMMNSVNRPNQDELDAFAAEMEASSRQKFDEMDAVGSRESEMMKTSSSMPALGTYNDLKKKTEFASTTVDGVLKRTTFLSANSNYESAPKFSIGIKSGPSFIKSSSTPAPGSYNVPKEESSKYKATPKFSFGGSSRFGMGQSPAKKQPGPGAYNPRDPAGEVIMKVGFGGSTRGKGQPMSTHNPGPGAYEYRSCLGEGRMFTAGGRHPVSYMRARSQPGPGAYNPDSSVAFGTPMKVGFGTSTRSDIASAARNLVAPGPGSYEMQNKLAVGMDAPKYSATSRRRLHDLNSYVTPGPGSYNSHATSFGE